MRVAVLGGTRFIGRAIVADLDAHGHDVLVVHRGQTEPDDLPAVNHLHADRHHLDAAAGELLAFGPDAVVDTLAMSRADADEVLTVLPAGLRTVVLSSADVYQAFASAVGGGHSDPVPIDETSPVRSERYPYRDSGRPGGDTYEKLDVEEAYLERGGVVLRLPVVYGEHDGQRREEFVLRRVRGRRTRIPFGPGNWLLSRVYVGDVAGITRLAVEEDQAAGQVLNLATRATWTFRQWAHEILAAAGWDATLVEVDGSRLPDDLASTGALAQHVLVDGSKARRLLGWEETDPKEAVGRSVQWHLAHPPADDDDWSADDHALAAAG